MAGAKLRKYTTETKRWRRNQALVLHEGIICIPGL